MKTLNEGQIAFYDKFYFKGKKKSIPQVSISFSCHCILTGGGVDVVGAAPKHFRGFYR